LDGNVENFGDRALKVRQHTKLSQEAFANEIGISSKQTVSNVEKGKQKKYSDDEINKIIDKFGISKQWFILGEGKMLQSDLTKSTQTLVDTGKHFIVPIISAQVSGSPSGKIHYEVVECGEMSVSKMLFKTIPNIEHVTAIEVKGHSMSPRINEGDYVVVDKTGFFDYDGIYVLQIDGMLLVKRLQVTTKGLKIISDNRRFDEDFYDPENDQRSVTIFGKVILVINQNMGSF
jgi:phage repressor protein C with HTH and peptisase S24 domain